MMLRSALLSAASAVGVLMLAGGLIASSWELAVCGLVVIVAAAVLRMARLLSSRWTCGVRTPPGSTCPRARERTARDRSAFGATDHDPARPGDDRREHGLDVAVADHPAPGESRPRAQAGAGAYPVRISLDRLAVGWD